MRIIVTILCVCSLIGAWAQTNQDSLREANLRCEVVVKAKSFGDKIVLRFGANNPIIWDRALTSGYKLERLEVSDNPEQMLQAQWTPIGNGLIKAKTESEFKALNKSSNDKYLKAAEGLLYSKESFEKEKEANSFLRNEAAVNNKFTFSLLVSDLSTAAADALGLRYEDRNIKAGAKYLYRVSTSANPGILKVDSGFAVIAATPYTPPAPPVIHRVEKVEKGVNLKWERQEHDERFTAYIIERSSDGGRTFKSLTELPFANPLDESGLVGQQYITYKDKLERNYSTFHYRVIGLTGFGERSAPSELVKGMGVDRTPPEAPFNAKAEAGSGNQINVTWDWKGNAGDFKGFYVGRNYDAGPDVSLLNPNALPIGVRNYVDQSPNALASNYYTVIAMDTAGNFSKSFAAMGFIEDNTPPSSPTGLKGEISEDGVVTLNWNQNKEEDFIGYYVYFANQEDHEFIRITPDPIFESSFSDSIVIKTTTKHIFYKVEALDATFNHSERTDFLKLKRPDVVAPTSPLIKDYIVGPGNITLKMVESSSEDVVQYELSRSSKNQGKTVIARLSPGELKQFVDQKVEPGKKYSYSIIAIDESGLRSKEAFVMTVRAWESGKSKKATPNLSARADEAKRQIVLNWSYRGNMGEFMHVYRKEAGNLLLIKSVSVNDGEFRDRTAEKGKIYEYTIRIVDKDGISGEFAPYVRQGL